MKLFIAVASLCIVAVAAEGGKQPWEMTGATIECRCCPFLEGGGNRRHLRARGNCGENCQREQGQGTGGGARGFGGGQGEGARGSGGRGKKNQHLMDNEGPHGSGGGRGGIGARGQGKQDGQGAGSGRSWAAAELSDEERLKRHEDRCVQREIDGDINCNGFNINVCETTSTTPEP